MSGLQSEVDSFLVHLDVANVDHSQDALWQLKQIFNELQKHKRPVVLLFDTYEMVQDGEIGKWLKDVVLFGQR